jgi:two-component system sensor histidine kinase DesK
MEIKRVQEWRGENWLAEEDGRTVGSDEAIVSGGISLRLWRLYAQSWLVCLLFPIIYLVNTPLAVMPLLVATSGLVIFVILYTWFMWPHPLSRGIRTRLGIYLAPILFAGLSVLALSLSLAFGSPFLWLFVGVSAVAAVALPARHAFVVVMILTLLTLGASIFLGGGIAEADWLQIVPLVLLVRGLGLDMIGLTRLSDALRALHAARSSLARQAVMEERLRLARDLHDLLGHTLSLITLKSELAGRLIEKDSTRAVQEVHEVERVARQALREVRAAVAGYRRPTLDDELDSARQILEAACVACTVENTVEALPVETDAALAWTVREAVTNVVRHSRAQSCLIQISQEDGTVCVEIINDGYHEQGRATAKTGVGLTGLAERISAQGGRMEAGPLTPLTRDGTPGFRLWVELPIQTSMTAGHVRWP